jgi:hypothetical protein
MLKYIKALCIATFARGATARDRAFNPIAGMEVLTHGETEIASLPSGITCCSVTAVNVPNDRTAYANGPFSELHVTTVGSSHYRSEEGEKGLYTKIYGRVNRPSSYRQFAFDVSDNFSEVCDDVTSGLTTSQAKSTANTCTDETEINRWKETHKKFSQLASREAAFTFFGPGEKQKETAVIRCWPLEEEVFVGAMLQMGKRKNRD